ELQLESEVGKGSCFRVVLPPTASEAAPLERQATPRAGRRARILVVDDEPMVCAIVRRALSREHEVSAVTSAQEALERILLGEGFDLILCDLLMPGMTGMDLHAELSARAPEQARRM